jgi:hypothetical protein
VFRPKFASMMKAFAAIAIILMVPMLALSQQKDSLIVKDTSGTVVPVKQYKKPFLNFGPTRDSLTGERVYSPRKAAIYSAIFPGLGQIYNRKYWKVPIVYAAVGIPIYMFFNNKGEYNDARYALQVVDNNTASDPEVMDKVSPVLKRFVLSGSRNTILNYRNQVRRNMDYSILFTLLFWGLNVVDATVDAHLKGFNVNDNLSMKIQPALISNQTLGVSIAFSFSDKHKRHKF